MTLGFGFVWGKFKAFMAKLFFLTLSGCLSPGNHSRMIHNCQLIRDPMLLSFLYHNDYMNYT